MKEWFRARTIWGAAIDTLSDAEAGRLMKALWHYAMSGEQPNLSGAERSIMALILMTLSQDEERDAAVSEKRAAAGSAGGKQRVANQANAKFASGFEATQAMAYSQSQNQNQKKYIDDDDEDEDDNTRELDPEENAEETTRRKAIRAAIEAQTGRRATPAEVTQISLRAKLHGQSHVMAALAVKLAAENGAKNLIRYTNEIFDDWDSEYVKTPEEAYELRRMYFEARNSGVCTNESHEEAERMQAARERRKAAHEAEVTSR